MYYALVDTLEYSEWCMEKERNGELYVFNTFMKEFLYNKGTKKIRYNVPDKERIDIHKSWILLKPGWSVKYNFI